MDKLKYYIYSLKFKNKNKLEICKLKIKSIALLKKICEAILIALLFFVFW